MEHYGIANELDLLFGPPPRASNGESVHQTGARSTMSAERVGNQTKSTAQSCDVAGCSIRTAAILDNQALCLEHFLSRCYDALECYDRQRDRATPVAKEVERAQVRRFLEECSTQALNICLRNENLNNLQRGRLLDILLWAGELSERVGAAQMKLSRSLDHANAGPRFSDELPTNS